MSISKGRLITFEGIDGSGKSTQAKKLVDYLNKSSETAIFVREPGGTTISEEIRDILLNRHLEDINDRTEALLMTGSRSQLTHEIIMPNLNKGLHVVADRYSDSTLAYQGGGRKIELEWLIQLNKFETYKNFSTRVKKSKKNTLELYSRWEELELIKQASESK